MTEGIFMKTQITIPKAWILFYSHFDQSSQVIFGGGDVGSETIKRKKKDRIPETESYFSFDY
jgi:hypothetical protein